MTPDKQVKPKNSANDIRLIANGMMRALYTCDAPRDEVIAQFELLKSYAEAAIRELEYLDKKDKE